MKTGVELIVGQLVVSLFLGFLGGIVGTFFYLFLTGQSLAIKRVKQIFKIYLLFFSLIFTLSFLLLHFFG